MDPFAVLAVKAAALREKIAVRDGETGLGIPNFGRGVAATPATPADLAAAVPHAPTSRHAPAAGRLLTALRSRPGKLGLAGGGLALLGGLGLGVAGRRPVSPAEPVVPAVPAPAVPDMAPRQVVKRSLLQRGKAAVGGWWSRMHNQYGRREVPREG